MASKAKKPRKVNGYKMPEPIPEGFIVKNIQKKAWKVGKSIGKGGFGEIYCCTPVDDNASTTTKSKRPTSYPYAMKIEPQENGPLFVEMHFYMKVGKQEDIESWTKSKGIKRLGMPHLAGSGSFDYNNERYRFIVIDRFGQDIWSLFLQNKKIFPCATVLKLGLQIIDIVEYIHDQGYAHCDVKGSNLLLGTQKGTEDQVYLVDFGLASRYCTAEYKPDPKKAHDGTIEYTSRDAHQGVITRRGDMEILGYNLLHWATSSLPWDDVTDPKQAEEKKNTLMSKVTVSAKKLASTAPLVIVKYLDYVSKLLHNQAPDYDFCRKLLKDELKKIGETNTGKLVFQMPGSKTPKKTPQKHSRVTKQSAVTDETPKKHSRVTRQSAVTDEFDMARNQDKKDSDRSGDENECQPPTPKRSAKKPKAKGPSWKDCESVKASGVLKAGEYVSSSPKPTKRQRKV